MGGIKITPNTEVVDTDGNVIPGLYAGGNDAGGLYGECYDVGSAAGSQASWAVNSGRIAAQEAQAYLESRGIASVGEITTEGPSDLGDTVVSDAVYTDGTYDGVGVSQIGGDIAVQVVVENGKVADVTYTHNEMTTIGGAALPVLVGEVVAQNTAEVDGVSGATYTSDAFKAAVAQALEAAQ